ncbi:MAG: hypothetical protein NVS9B10_19990 [Nevskia sp.]
MRRSESIGRGRSAAIRQRVNLTVRKDYPDLARASGVNLSRVLEESPAARLKSESQRRWLEEDRAGIDEYKAYIEKYGCFGDRFRSLWGRHRMPIHCRGPSKPARRRVPVSRLHPGCVIDAQKLAMAAGLACGPAKSLSGEVADPPARDVPRSLRRSTI